MFKVERIVALKVLDAQFRVDPSFNLDDYFGNAWSMARGDKRYHIKIRFLNEAVADVGEVEWHKTQRTTYRADGSLLFEADVDGIDEIRSWILGYGEQAQVLEPPELQRLVATHAAHMLAYYDKHSALDVTRLARETGPPKRHAQNARLAPTELLAGTLWTGAAEGSLGMR